jgi:aryl-alcohol dehydrogenase-like predicted oxidoreductase
MGYGASHGAGLGVWGLPANIDEAVAVLRDAVAAGVNHIDTSDFYGPSHEPTDQSRSFIPARMIW